MLRALAFTLLHLMPLNAVASDCGDGLAPGSPTPAAHMHKDLNSYTAAMEMSALQKAAFGSMARPGKIADLGAGSGISARDLAVLFPDSTVVGVDFDPAMVAHANQHYQA